MHHSVRKLVATAMAATFAMTAVAPALAAEPVVQGPESVADWWNAGQAFVADSRKLHPWRHVSSCTRSAAAPTGS